jgi:hypothetical protein
MLKTTSIVYPKVYTLNKNLIILIKIRIYLPEMMTILSGNDDHENILT